MKFKKPTYSKLDALFASPTEPMPKQLRESQLTRMYTGLASIERDATPTTDDWRILSDCVNLMESLVDMGYIQDEQGLIMDAINALGKAGSRNLKGHPIRLDAAGIVAVRGVLEDYAMCIESLPHRVMVECHRRTEKRIREILAGKKKPHDVEVMSC